MPVPTMKATLSIAIVASLFFVAPAIAQQVAAVQGSGDVFSGAKYSTLTIADQWGLEEAEITRYQQLMIVEKHYGSPQISPLEVLGKHARNYAEASKYAQMAVDKYNEQVRKSLEWTVLFSNLQESGKKTAYEIVAESDLIREHLEAGDVDTDIFYKRWQDEIYGTHTASGAVQSIIESRTRVRYFVDLESCNSACDSIWAKIRKRLLDGGVYTGIDVIFMDSDGVKPTRAALSQWAMQNDISPDEVEMKAITLNWNNDRYTKILGVNQLPIAIESSGSLIKR